MSEQGDAEKPPPGWYDAPRRPGLEMYWDGAEWSSDVPPRSKPEKKTNQARTVAWGILMAAAVIFVIWKLMQPSAAECATQQLEVTLGERASVESGCIGR